ncbi:MAG: hypothetical protein M3Y73_03100 [Actinomycetota bacterium]|nr:hypothetical protein [Actinomycetota bacterium]
MPVPSARLKTYTEGHLDFHASQRWPQLEEITISWRGGYGYVTAYLPDEEQLPICRLRYLGSDTDWGFALYRASSEDYDDALLPDGSPSGTPEQALDCALGLYLADPTASGLDQTPEGLMRRCTSPETGASESREGLQHRRRPQR